MENVAIEADVVGDVDVTSSGVVDESKCVDDISSDVVPSPPVVDCPVVRGLTEEDSWLDVVSTTAGVDRCC